MKLCTYHQDRQQFLGELRVDAARAESHNDPRVKNFYASQLKSEQARFDADIKTCGECEEEPCAQSA